MRIYKPVWLFILCIFSSGIIIGQTIPRDELIFLTSQWKGDRFADGRPKVADDLLIRAKNIGIDGSGTQRRHPGKCYRSLY